MMDAIKGALLALVGRRPVDHKKRSWSYNIVGGGPRFYTSFEERKTLPTTEAAAILRALQAGHDKTPFAQEDVIA